MHFVQARSILTKWNGVNVYRGCSHGCIYCDSRSDCYRFTHPFEDIEVKENAPELLEKALSSKRKKCVIGSGSMSDPYQPCEKELGMTRRCLEMIKEKGFGATVITKSDLVLRDIDLFESINRRTKATVQMTLTCADSGLSRILEPNVCDTRHRYEVLKELQRHGIPTVVWMTPLLPFLTDTRENVDGILEYCIDAGVKGIVCFGIGMTLRQGNREYYYKALDRHFPGLSDRYRSMYGDSYNIVSPNNKELMEHFHSVCERNGILHTPEDCFSYIAEIPSRQRTLFD